MTGQYIADLLRNEAARINRPEFIGEDPVQFPRLFDTLQDIEITALTVAAISWGRRAMILRDARRMLDIMERQPYRYMMEKGYETLDPASLRHSTYTALFSDATCNGICADFVKYIAATNHSTPSLHRQGRDRTRIRHGDLPKTCCAYRPMPTGGRAVRAVCRQICAPQR